MLRCRSSKRDERVGRLALAAVREGPTPPGPRACAVSYMAFPCGHVPEDAGRWREVQVGSLRKGERAKACARPGMVRGLVEHLPAGRAEVAEKCYRLVESPPTPLRRSRSDHGRARWWKWSPTLI